MQRSKRQASTVGLLTGSLSMCFSARSVQTLTLSLTSKGSTTRCVQTTSFACTWVVLIQPAVAMVTDVTAWLQCRAKTPRRWDNSSGNVRNHGRKKGMSDHPQRCVHHPMCSLGYPQRYWLIYHMRERERILCLMSSDVMRTYDFLLGTNCTRLLILTVTKRNWLAVKRFILD